MHMQKILIREILHDFYFLLISFMKILIIIQGRQYDGAGNLAPWWTEETLQV
jgi:hypothetical protein